MCVSHSRLMIKNGQKTSLESEDELRNFLVEQCVEWLTSIQLLAAGCTALLFCLQDHYDRPRAFFQLRAAEIDRSILPSQDDWRLERFLQSWSQEQHSDGKLRKRSCVCLRGVCVVLLKQRPQQLHRRLWARAVHLFAFDLIIPRHLVTVGLHGKRCVLGFLKKRFIAVICQ